MSKEPVFPPEIRDLFFSPQGSMLRDDVISWARWRGQPAETEDNQWEYLQFAFRSHCEFRNVFDYRLRNVAGFNATKYRHQWPRANDLYIYTDFIGGGFRIQHGHSTWVMAETIGKNFHVNQNVTIGVGKGGKPVIGDNVSVFTGAVVTGKIRIGNNVTIAPNAFVNFDVDDNTAIFPAPMIVKTKQTGPQFQPIAPATESSDGLAGKPNIIATARASCDTEGSSET